MAASDIDKDAGAGRRIEVHADGCYEPSDQSGGWAFVACRDGQEVASDFGHVARSSNNAMELMALLRAATWIQANATGEPSVLWSDSVYAVTGCNQWRPIWKSRGWRKKGPDPKARSRVIPDRELWIAIDDILSKNGQIEVVWCKGHSGIAGNEKSDKLAEQGRRSKDARSPASKI
jgi:ribonuclease HI